VYTYIDSNEPTITVTATGVVLSGRCLGRVYRLWFTLVYVSRLASTDRGGRRKYDTGLEKSIVQIQSGDLPLINQVRVKTPKRLVGTMEVIFTCC
jgi:hypothetical protein